ncbi:DNA-binding response regulator [Aeromicrobium sp. 636]|uniref:Response regulator transcription factor n=1 Tax=Aeromicrobium senzhongii TaxID=2663859 RepID=A0A8I0K0Y6_9ACTN|nr:MULTISPECIES: response regulator transcription factor [Aeromicrobium]MBC9226881.1 response regulator transcription factor [Aeromicrobium senzhongii]MCQ3998981.1 DNA-binding response regulator [Aeromicrobium sp. 636]MTB89513.1 DNA-binding response regulator [Aeromicrobium senzhongii]QNL94354.1 response regulator transcription factor [Aeromicrobium senzhongii]
MTDRPRVVVIDDSTVIRGGFATVHPEVEVVATYASVEQFEAAPVECDVVVLDLLLRGPQGAGAGTKQGRAAIRAVRARGLPVCLYTDERRAIVLALCLRAGAHGVVHKSDQPAVTVRAIEDVRAGNVVVTQSLVGLTELLDRRGVPLELSPRQRQVISRRARGRHWADIAGELYITEDTAREHYRAACAKLREYLRHTSPGDIERAVGLAPGDVLDEA